MGVMFPVSSHYNYVAERLKHIMNERELVLRQPNTLRLSCIVEANVRPIPVT